nr:MAG TPA: hypothetical protein [Caudoviricetes sp.]
MIDLVPIFIILVVILILKNKKLPTFLNINKPKRDLK